MCLSELFDAHAPHINELFSSIVIDIYHIMYDMSPVVFLVLCTDTIVDNALRDDSVLILE